MTRDWRCIKCDGNPDWKDCLDCSIDDNDKPITCTACPEDLTLISNGDDIPKWMCGDEPIDNCFDQDGQNCT